MTNNQVFYLDENENIKPVLKNTAECYTVVKIRDHSDNKDYFITKEVLSEMYIPSEYTILDTFDNSLVLGL